MRMFVRFNSSKAAASTSIKLDAIDHHPGKSVIRSLITSSPKVFFSNIAFLMNDCNL